MDLFEARNDVKSKLQPLEKLVEINLRCGGCGGEVGGMATDADVSWCVCGLLALQWQETEALSEVGRGSGGRGDGAEDAAEGMAS